MLNPVDYYLGIIGFIDYINKMTTANYCCFICNFGTHLEDN